MTFIHFKMHKTIVSDINQNININFCFYFELKLTWIDKNEIAMSDPLDN